MKKKKLGWTPEMACKNRKAIYVYVVLGSIFLDLGNKLNCLIETKTFLKLKLLHS